MTTSKWSSDPALITSSGRSYSFSQSASWIQNLSSKLSGELEVQDARVAVLIHNRLFSGIVSLAVMENNLCIPLNAQFKDDELLELIRDTSSTLVVVDKMFYQTRKNLLDELQIRVLLFDEGKADPSISHLPDYRASKYENQKERGSSPSLMLLTSGTTGKSKQVVLDHTNLRHGMIAVGESLSLTSEDRAVNMLPMVHIGGIIDLLMAPLYYGCSVLFLDPKDVHQYSSFITDKNVTWVQGSPAILQHLIRSVDYDESVSNLRLIRSVSAPLSSSLLYELEKFFSVPVIEIYGMSEASGVITSNPISQDARKVGSVGRAINAEISIRKEGQVWVKSAGVFDGYLNLDKNEDDWDGEWFHTGDLGYQDEDGFLYLTGRSKEQINRGGQKVSPMEIDQLMDSWGEVTEAASFGVPHPSLGEEVAVAVVLRSGQELDLDEIKSRLAVKLADYKVPCKVVYIDALPRNQNGKLQRDQLKDVDGSSAEMGDDLECGDHEGLIQSLFCKVLGVDEIGLDDDFFEAGGDSLSAVNLVNLLEKNTTSDLTNFRIFEHSTVRKVSAYIQDHLSEVVVSDSLKREVSIRPAQSRKLQQILSNWQGLPAFPGAYCVTQVPIGKSKTPYLFFCGNGNQEYEVFLKAAKDIYQVIGFRTLRKIQHKWFRDRDLLAQAYVHDIITIQNEGPYYLGGYCEGANIMIRVAEILIQRGLEVRQLILHDHVIDRPIKFHASMMFSQQASMNQLRFYYNVERGWNKLFRGNYGFIELKGGHNRYNEADFHESIRPFLVDELNGLQRDQYLLKQEGSSHTEEYQLTIKQISKLPRVLRVGHEYYLKLKVANEDSRDLLESDGYAVHARWVDLAGDLKFNEPMRAKLPEILPSGDSAEVEVKILPSKKKRMYRLEIAVLEEGFQWSKQNKNYLQKWYILI